ncbi:MAG: stress response translation initiation inhibitor YciH [Candidatus Rokuibacteriota bacterium]|nr:MAG: stress response translation initiation inhibitor YciH [Candidatus Rokubacteria bacterium]
MSDRHCISSLPRSAEQYTPPCYTGAVKNSRSVYSTDKGRLGEPEPRRSAATPAPSVPEDGVVRIFRERGGRNGKVVTVLRGLPPRELEARAAELKRLCGAGAAVKEGVVEIQGDHRDRIAARLRALGHRVKLAGG